MCTWDLGINGSLLARHPQSAPSFGTCNTCPGGKKNLLQQPTGHSETHCYERGGYLAGSGIAGGEKSVLEGVSPLQNRPSSHPRTPASSEQTAHHCSLPLGSDPCAKKVFLREANSLCFPLCPFSCLYGRTTVQKQGAWIIAGSQPWFIYPMAERLQRVNKIDRAGGV